MVVRLRQLLVSRLLSRSLRCSEMGCGPTLYLMSHVGGARTPPSMSVEGEEKGVGAGGVPFTLPGDSGAEPPFAVFSLVDSNDGRREWELEKGWGPIHHTILHCEILRPELLALDETS